MAATRQESDTLGTIDVPAEKLWGAQTQRALENFRIGWQQFPPEFIRGYALVKKAAAITNNKLGKLDGQLLEPIVSACNEIIAGKHDDEFPLPVWQTGSGTQTNMNLNEVIANRANEMLGAERGSKSPVHPNDHVNLSQSTNDTFPTAMHVSAVTQVRQHLLPALDKLESALRKKEIEFEHRIKSGRTHMMDATPVTLGQEFGAYRAQLDHCYQQLVHCLCAAQQLAIGGSAVGTGLNTHPEWSNTVANVIAELAGIEFKSANNKFMALSGHEALVDLHSALRTLASALFKIANDLRLMASGPRCGLGEIQLPTNEPGSSIMPGKVNPTQIEALTQVALRIFGNDSTIAMANSQGQFELNVYKPVMIELFVVSTDPN